VGPASHTTGRAVRHPAVPGALRSVRHNARRSWSTQPARAGSARYFPVSRPSCEASAPNVGKATRRIAPGSALRQLVRPATMASA